jgi:hypothetical protein
MSRNLRWLPDFINSEDDSSFTERGRSQSDALKILGGAVRYPMS